MPMTKQATRAAIDDPQVGSIKRRVLKRKLAGVVAIGPSAPPEPPQPPTQADQIRGLRSKSAISRAHRQTVEREIKLIDERISLIDARFAASRSGIVTDETIEATAERRQLREMRRDLENEIERPTLINRDGRELTAHDRAVVRARAKELTEILWINAERAAAEGDHRRARTLRRDALRSRQIAEMESGWRGSLPGYGNFAWS